MYDTQCHNKHCQKKNTPANSISVNLPNAHTSAYVTWCHIMISVAVDMITWPILQSVTLQFFLYTYSKCHRSQSDSYSSSSSNHRTLVHA